MEETVAFREEVEVSTADVEVVKKKITEKRRMKEKFAILEMENAMGEVKENGKDLVYIKRGEDVIYSTTITFLSFLKVLYLYTKGVNTLRYLSLHLFLHFNL